MKRSALGSVWLLLFAAFAAFGATVNDFPQVRIAVIGGTFIPV